MEQSQYLFLIYALFFLAATLFALLTNSIFLRFARTMGAKNQRGAENIRWSSETKPAIGGITFFIVFLLALGCYSIFFEPEDVFKNKQLVGMLLAMLIAFMMGLADDAYNTRPLLKFSVQVLCGVLLVLSGTTIQLFDLQVLNDTMTVVWVVGIMNSINMLDNMDAITTVVAVFISISALLNIYISGQLASVDFMLICGVLAGLVGFLFFNWHPSKMYMGDTGSQFLGLFLAFIGIKYCWNATGLHEGLMFSKQIALTLLIFMMPIVDTTIVVTNRIRRGQSPFVGGRDHTTHILSYQGLSDSQVAMTFGGMSALSVIVATFILKYVTEWTIWHGLSILAYFVIILGVMFYLSKINKDKYTS
jgi:UDP-GlcNAc:undecaprenyl-phosphate GlcNAc-1-phosphate transferase